MSSPTGGERVVDALRGEGVRHVFGIPGYHNLAVYDALLGQGYDRDSARHFVADEMEATLRRWGARRPLGADA